MFNVVGEHQNEREDAALTAAAPCAGDLSSRCATSALRRLRRSCSSAAATQQNENRTRHIGRVVASFLFGIRAMYSRIIFAGVTLLLVAAIVVFPNLREVSTLNLAGTAKRRRRSRSLPSPSKRDVAKQRQRQVRQKYLYYYSHSGISNQLLGLARAAQLCFSTNRILILPPVLPHYGEFPEEFLSFHGRTAGGGCNPYEQSATFIVAARYDAVLCKRNQYNYPKFSEIINISELSRLMNVTMIELGDFIKYKPRLASKHFIRRRTRYQLIDLDGSCTMYLSLHRGHLD